MRCGDQHGDGTAGEEEKCIYEIPMEENEQIVSIHQNFQVNMSKPNIWCRRARKSPFLGIKGLIAVGRGKMGSSM